MKKILLLSNWSDNIAELKAVTEPNKREYAERHGYAFANEKTEYAPEGHVSWLMNLKDQLDYYDTVMTVGCDVLFMDMRRKIEAIQKPLPVTIGQENISWWPINNDVMIWQRCSQAQDILDLLIDDAGVWLEYKWLWQVHLWNLIQTVPCVAESIDIREARFMNSCLQPGLGQWQLGDWILHLLSMPNDQKVKLAKDYLRFAGDGCYYPET